jgi:uracil phosphoribosyltransferase
MRARIADRSGLRLFRAIVKAQGGDVRVVDEPDRLARAKLARGIASPRDGFVSRLDARRIGHAGVLVGAGRAYKEQELDYGAGLALVKKVGDRVRRGETLAVLHAADGARLDAGEREYRAALEISSRAPRRAPTNMAKLYVSDHPLVQDKLARLRDKSTAPEDFRGLMAEVALLLGGEVLKGVRTRKSSVQTPLKSSPAVVLDQPLAFVAVLRAGLGMTPGLLQLAPKAAIGHIGLYRNEETLNPVRYYVRLPKRLSEHFVVLCDPMLATGGSASESIHILKTDGAKQIALLTLLSSKRGVERIQRDHPDVPVFTAAVDAVLNSKGYIVPGLGDAGDRLFNT